MCGSAQCINYISDWGWPDQNKHEICWPHYDYLPYSWWMARSEKSGVKKLHIQLVWYGLCAFYDLNKCLNQTFWNLLSWSKMETNWIDLMWFSLVFSCTLFHKKISFNFVKFPERIALNQMFTHLNRIYLKLKLDLSFLIAWKWFVPKNISHIHVNKNSEQRPRECGEIERNRNQQRKRFCRHWKRLRMRCKTIAKIMILNPTKLRQLTVKFFGS